MQKKAQNNMATVAKTQGKKKKKTIISRENRKKIIIAYYQMFSAFVLQNLMSGITLGAALHKSLQLIRAKLATMDKANPVTKMLLRLNKRHSKRIAKFVMTSKYRNATAKIKPEQRAKISAKIATMFKSANAVFNAMSAQYKPKQNTKPVQQKNAPSLQILLLQNQRQRTAA